jgi:hypothetical protein
VGQLCFDEERWKERLSQKSSYKETVMRAPKDPASVVQNERLRFECDEAVGKERRVRRR